MRKSFQSFLLLCLLSSLAIAQSQNINLLGHQAGGRAEAVFRRNGITFFGNGAYLEAYHFRSGNYDLKDRILLPGPIYDIWVQSGVSDAHPVYVACGEKGLRIAYFNFSTESFTSTIDSLDTPGFTSGVTQYGSLSFYPYLYLRLS